MIDLLVFTQYPKSYAPKRFMNEAKSKKLSVQVIGYKSINLNDLPKAEVVILREPDAKDGIYNLRDQILNYYILTNSKVLNAESYLSWSILDKLKQHREFKKSGISHLPLLKSEKARYPFIVKDKLGSHGDSVYKLENKEDLNKILLKHKLKDLLIQEFQTSGFDLRVIVLGCKVLGIMKRTPKTGEFLSNYSQGGKIARFEVTAGEQKVIDKLAINTAKHFKLDYVGVDLMMGNDCEWKVLEVNRACQFKGFEQSTGINVASEVIQFLSRE